jgi:hypothetical protein
VIRRSARLGRGVIATLTTAGVQLKTESIPWTYIRDIRLQPSARGSAAQIVLDRIRPRPARTLVERLNSFLSQGRSDLVRVIRVPQGDEAGLAILQHALRRWEQAGGTKRSTLAAKPIDPRGLPTWLVAIMMMVTFAFALHGHLVNFQPSLGWSIVCLALVVPLTVAGTLKLLRSGAFIREGYQGQPNYIAVFFIFCMAGIFALWFAICLSCGSFATNALGEGSARVVAFDKRYHHSTKGCRHPLTLHLDNRARYCASPELHALLPAAGPLRVRLRESWFGVNIVSVSTAEN